MKSPVAPFSLLELLEARIAPATLVLAGGVLTYTAADGVANDITLSAQANTVVLSDDGETIDISGAPGFALSDGDHTATGVGTLPDSIVLATQDGADEISVKETHVPLSIVSTGSAKISLGADGSKLIAGHVDIQAAGIGTDQLFIHGDTETAAFMVTVQSATVGVTGDTFFGMNGTVTYSGIEELTLSTGTGANTVKVATTGAGTATKLISGGLDAVSIGLDGSVQGIAGSVEITNPTTLSDLTIDNSADTADHSVTVTDSSVMGLAPATIIFTDAGVDHFTLLAGTGMDSISVNSLQSGAENIIDAGGGNDSITVNATSDHASFYGGAGADMIKLGAGNLDTLTGTISVQDDGDASDLLVLDDSGATGTLVYELTPTSVSWNGFTDLTFGGITNLTLQTHSGDDTFNVLGTVFGMTEIQAGAGVNVLNLGAGAQSLGDFSGPVKFSPDVLGTNTVVIDESGESDSHEYFFDVTQIQLLRDGDPVYIGFATLTFMGGSGNDHIDFSSYLNNAFLFGGDGDDLFVGGSTSGALHGGAGRDTYLLTGVGADVTVTDLGTTFTGGVVGDSFPDHDFEIVNIGGTPAVNHFDATGFHGFAVLDGNGGLDVIKGSDVKFTAKTVTYRDFDNDNVTITSTKGHIGADNLFFRLNAAGTGALLETLDLNGSLRFKGSAITIKGVHTALGGDGRVNVGFFDAEGVDLASFTMSGDLSNFTIGDDTTAAPAIGTLTVGSLFTFGLFNQDDFTPDTSVILGNAGTITVKGNVGDIGGPGGEFLGILSDSVNPTSGNLAALNVSGSLGSIITADGNITAATIKGSVLFGVIGAERKLGTIKIGRDLFNGFIYAGAASDFAPAKQADSVVLKSLTVGGSVSAGTFIVAGASPFGFGEVNPDVSIGTITVKGSWNRSSISAGREFTSPDIGEDTDIVATPLSGDFAGMVGGNPAIVATIASITIKGQVSGNFDGFPGGFGHYGFVAQKVAAFKVGALPLALTATAQQVFEVGFTGDVSVREVA